MAGWIDEVAGCVRRCAVGVFVVWGLVAVALPASADEVPTSSDGAARKVAASVCTACHGAAGQSQSSEFPHLAAQQESYLSAQLRAFRSRTRAEPSAHDYMWGMATLLEDPVIDALARYYAAQPAAPGRAGDAALTTQGQKLFSQGDAARNIQACASCHGERAQGSFIFPRLAGQHAAYVEKQLGVIQHKLRDAPIMHGVVKDLSAAEIHALAVYVQGL